MSAKAAPAPSTAKPESAHSATVAVRSQPAKVHASPGPAAFSIASRLQGGSPLPPTLQQRMESSFGRSFDDVRVHTGGAADSLTQEHRAEALTIGSHIAFGTGRFHPETPEGQYLLAHELTHVAQQETSAGNATTPQAQAFDSTPGEPAEVAAETAASQAMRGERVRSIGTGYSIHHRVMRRALFNLQPPPNPAPLRGRVKPSSRSAAPPPRAREAVGEVASVQPDRAATAAAALTPSPATTDRRSRTRARQRAAPRHTLAREGASPNGAERAPGARPPTTRERLVARFRQPVPPAEESLAEPEAAAPAAPQPLPHTHDATSFPAPAAGPPPPAAAAATAAPTTAPQPTPEPPSRQEGGTAEPEAVPTPAPSPEAPVPMPVMGMPPAASAAPGSAVLSSEGEAAIPGDVGPEIRALLGSFQNSLRAGREDILTSLESAQQDLTSTGEDAKSQISTTVVSLSDDFSANVSERVQSVESHLAATEGDIAARREEDAAQTAEVQASAATQVESTWEGGTQQLEGARDESAGTLESYGESKANEASLGAEANANEARQVAASYANRYSGEAADDASNTAQDHGSDMAESMQEQGAMLAEAARNDGSALAEELRGGAQLALDGIAAAQPMAMDGLASLGTSATTAMDQVAQEAAPQAQGLAADATMLLQSTGDAILSALGNLETRFHLLADLGMTKGTAALALSAQQRIAAIDSVEAQVMEAMAGLPADPTGELSEALLEVEGAVNDEEAVSTQELAAGGTVMSDEIDAGAGMAGQSADRLRSVGETVTLDIEGQADAGLQDINQQSTSTFDQITMQAGQAIEEAVQCTLSYFLPVIASALEDLGLRAEEGQGQIDQKTDPALERQREDIHSFAEVLEEEWREYINEGGLVGTLAVIALFLVAWIEAFVGIIWGIIEAVITFVIGLVLLVVGLVVALFALGFIAGVLFMSLWECVGLLPALFLTLVFLAVAVIMLALALAALIVVGLGFLLYSIVMNIITAFTSDDPTLGPFERGRLIGLAVGDILLLLIPFAKGKLKLRVPTWLAKWLARIRPLAGLLLELLRLCEYDVALLVRLVRLIRNLARLEAVLTKFIGAGGRARGLAAVLEAAVRDVAVFQRLVLLADESPALLVNLLRLVGDDARLLVEFLRIVGDAARLETILTRFIAAGGSARGLATVLEAAARDAAVLQQLVLLAEQDAALLIKLLRLVGDDARLLVDLLRAVGGDAARLDTLLGLADNPRQLALFLRGVVDLAELERLLILMRDWRIPFRDIEWLITDQGMQPLDALRLVEGLMTERGGIHPVSAGEARTILQAWREGIINGPPRRTIRGEPDIDFALGRAGRATGFIDIKTPISPRLNPLPRQAANIAESIAGYGPNPPRVIVDLRNLNLADKNLFVALLRNELQARGLILDDLIAANLLTILNWL